MAAPNAPAVQLTADEIDDILYLTRTNDTAELLPYLSQLAQQHGASSPVSILEACVDEYSGNTAFHYAAANGSTELLQSLISLIPTSTDPTTTSTSTTTDPTSPRKTLLNAKNNQGNTPLHWASLNGHASVVSCLTSSGADCWVKNAAGNLPVFEAERAGKDEVVAVLLLAGGKEVEDQLRGREGVVERGDEVDVDGEDGHGGEGSSAAGKGADEAAEKLARTGLD